MSRKERRAAEHIARKAARKAGFPTDTANRTASIVTEPDLSIPEPGLPFPPLSALSPARVAANRANAQHSTGPVTPAGVAASSQNHTTHGLARHNGAFRLLSTEDPAGFEALKQRFRDEHQPATETESVLIDTMAESHWLTNRAQRLIDTCTDPDTGVVTNEKSFALYLRYQTTHRRAFHKALNDLLKLRAEERKAELGFEAQRVKTEQHEMKKQSHYWDVLRKDGQACHQMAINTLQELDAAAQFPGFEAQFAANLAARGVQKGNSRIATRQTTPEEQAA